MLYNTLGKTGLEVSRLGFGTMRLPTKGSNDNIDKAEATAMLEYGIRSLNFYVTNMDFPKTV